MITIGLPPEIALGPLTLSWHGLAILAGSIVGWWVFLREAPRFGFPKLLAENALIWVLVAGVVGSRLYYTLQADPAGYLSHPWRILAVWEGGFAFYGAVFLVPLVFWWLSRRYRVAFWPAVDLLALATAVGMAIGRIGDVIIGEHYGPPTSLPWGVIYTVAGPERPTPGVAVQSGALYEVGVDILIFAVAWLLRERLSARPGQLFAFVLGAFALSRVFIFSIVRDVPEVALGLNNAQWTSLVALGVAVVIAAYSFRASSARSEKLHG
ncbi:MAG: prolipoprotein diacylglyceryl transferase [Rubrobacteraceae bacterium]